MTYTYKVRKVPKDSLMLVWKCEHIKKEKVPILLWKHKPIFVPQTQEWIVVPVLFVVGSFHSEII